MQVLFCL